MATQLSDYNAGVRQDFCTFSYRAFRELNPATAFVHNWHIEFVASKLGACQRGKTTRLIITIPPRSLKSHSASVALPAFILGHNPGAQIICASYNQDFADKLASDCRQLISSPWYQSVFPTRLAAHKHSVQEFATNEGGFRLATSVGGTLTGRGADFIIIDDPLKPSEASSETRRTSVNEWFDHTLYSRLNDKRKGVIIITMQRLHEDDLVGHVLEQERWDHVRLSAIAEEDEEHVIESLFGRRVVRRRAGEALDPQREPLSVLERLRQTLGEYNFAGQYQQSPAPQGGGMVKKEWFKVYTSGSEPANFDLVFQSWDTANKSSELTDYSVCTTWGSKGQDLYILNVFRQRVAYPDLKRAVVKLARRDRANNVLIEDKASGTQLIQELSREGLRGLTRYEPKMDKIMRLHSVTGTIENGFVHVPERAEWLNEYLHELTTFPNGRHDDQTDSTSQALDWFKQIRFTFPVLEYYRSEAAKLGVFLDVCEGPLQTQQNGGVAVHETTGRKIRWDGLRWLDYHTGEPYVE